MPATDVPVAPTATVAPSVEVTATVELTPVGSVTAEPTEVATATPEPTETAKPTETPSPTATPDTKRYYTVVAGDSLMLIGEKTGIDWQLIAQVNGLTTGSMMHPGDRLVLPPESGASAATPLPAAPAANPTRYTVQAGDSLAAIGARFGLNWEDVARANGLNQSSMLMPGQELVIPVSGGAQPAPTATPSAQPQAASAAAATPAPSFPAPRLLSPSDGTPFSGSDQFVELTWQRVDGLPTGAQYRVAVGFTSNGVAQERSWTVTALGIQVPPVLWGLADQPARLYSWYVCVVQVATDGKGGERVVPLSPPSPTWAFSWS